MANWSDLGPRVWSAAVMSLVGGIAIWLGGPVFLVLVLVTIAAMVWEVLVMCDLRPKKGQVLLPITFVCVVFLATFNISAVSWVLLVSSVLLAAGGALGATKQRLLAGVALFAVFWVGYGAVYLRSEQGVVFLIWLILVVVASDVMGYFAGKTFGGPKFWPSISPKKTWSGTVAGWFGAALVGLGFVIWRDAPIDLIAISVLTAFAGQMGDIAESALKRKTNIKDSSNLIPGHGGVLDRFDAVSGAVLFLLALSAVLPVSV